MRFGENNKNITELEQSAGKKAARSIGRNLRNLLGSEFELSNPSIMKKNTGASAKMKHDALDRLIIRSTSVGFIQHYGFEGIKKNGVAMSLKPKDQFNKLFEHTRALNTLADEIGNLRSEEVTAKIQI